MTLLELLRNAVSQVMNWGVPGLGITYLELFGGIAFLTITIKFLKRVFGTEANK